MEVVVGAGVVASAVVAVGSLALRPARFRIRMVAMLALGFLVNFFARGNITGLLETLEQQLDLSISQLGALPCVAELAGALVLPFWGWLSDRQLKRLPTIFALSFVLAGLATGLTGLTWNFATVLIARCLSGMFLLSVYTLASTFLMHLFAPEARGRLFGAMALCTAVGSFAGAICGALVTGQGDLWRWLFASVGVVLAVFGAAFVGATRDFTPRVFESGGTHLAFWGTALRKPTFVILSITSALNNLPLLALSFLLLWFRYVGFSEAQSNGIFAFAAVGLCCGSVVGGIVSDRAFRVTGKATARIAVSQVSILLTLTVTLCLLFFVPRDPSSFWWFCACIFALGFFVIWSYTGCDLVLIADIIPRDKMAGGIALAQLIQGTLASFGSLLVGFVAQRAFGYVARTEPIDQMPAELRASNTTALTLALVLVLCSTWAAVFVLYSPVYFTYGPDRARADSEKTTADEPVRQFLTPLSSAAEPMGMETAEL